MSKPSYVYYVTKKMREEYANCTDKQILRYVNDDILHQWALETEGAYFATALSYAMGELEFGALHDVYGYAPCDYHTFYQAKNYYNHNKWNKSE